VRVHEAQVLVESLSMKRIKTLAGDVYMADEVDEALKRQAAAAIAGMNAATAISAGQVQQAHRLRAESSPEALESERQANAILTARIAELESELDTMNLAVGYFHEENDRFITRIAELQKLLTECLNTNENEHMDPDLVTRVNRALMESKSP
jgi:hypothetical protein